MTIWGISKFYIRELMQKHRKKQSLLKPVALLLLQLVALMSIFKVLSSNETVTEQHHTQLLVSLIFIIVSSLYTFKTLHRLKAEALDEEKPATF